MSREEDRQRTAQERERARLEREARRAAKRGEGSDPLSAPDLRGQTPPPPDLRGQTPPPEPEVQPAPAGPRRAARDRVADRAAAARVALRARRKRVESAEQAPAAPPASPRPPRSTLFRVAVGAGAVLALVAAWFLFSLFQPFKGEGEGEVRVQIPTGASVTQIGDILEENDVIASAFFFRARVTLGGSRGDLKPGSYRLKRDMSYSAAIDALSEGPPKDIVTITIPEGRSRPEVAAIVEEAGLTGNYEQATVRSSGLDLSRYKAGGAADLEGFLFPATYELKRGASVEDLVSKQIAAFKEQFAAVDLREAKRKNLTPYDVLIIASMVEREASLDQDRPLVASVIYNRLRAGMPLGIDATIRFALGNWTEPLKQSELASPSPYNTRTNVGLPPGPIGNPGLESIEAAANPAESDYLFFVVKPCGEGEHAFSETDAEFQADVARYEAEREAQGGQSPTEC